MMKGIGSYTEIKPVLFMQIRADRVKSRINMRCHLIFTTLFGGLDLSGQTFTPP